MSVLETAGQITWSVGASRGSILIQGSHLLRDLWGYFPNQRQNVLLNSFFRLHKV